MINRFAGPCRNPRCDQPSTQVEEGQGRLVGSRGAYEVYHDACVAVLNEDPMAKFADFEPSDYQQAVLDAWTGSQSHLVVNAVAGSGKTKTILWLIAKTWREGERALRRKPRVLLCCFNKEIQEELVRRVHPGTADARTLNSLGHRMLKMHLDSLGFEISLDKKKLYGVVGRLFPRNERELKEHWDSDMDGATVYQILWHEYPKGLESWEFEIEIQRAYQRNEAWHDALVSLAGLRRATLGNDDAKIAAAYSVDLPWIAGTGVKEIDDDCKAGLSPAVSLVLEEMKRVALERGVVDYDDQVWLPVLLGLRRQPYDAVFVDEAQDLNEAQLQLLFIATGSTGRMVCVGDRFQAIYSFRGAGIGMLRHVKRTLAASQRGAAELPLNYCYRCPTAVIDYVHKTGHVMHIQAAPGAEVGEVSTVKDSRHWDSPEWDQILAAKDVMILCRTNAPLVSAYFKLIRKKIPSSIRGRGEGGVHGKLLGLIRRCKGKGDLPGLMKRAEVRCKRQVEILWSAKRYGQATSICDLFEVLLTLSEESESLADLHKLADEVFKGDKDMRGITLSTVHKAKGLEENTVVVIRPDLLPMTFYATTENEIAQEMNLQYVCYTRAKKRLVIASVESVGGKAAFVKELFPEINLGRK